MSYVLKNKFGIYPEIYDTRGVFNWNIGNFNEFDDVYLNTRKINSFNDVVEDQANTDFFIFPGDQIWNFECRPHKFFHDLFTLPGIRRRKIAYSVSDNDFFRKNNIGASDWRVERIRNVDSVSLREADTVDFLSSICGKRFSTAIDSVFLVDLDVWKYLAKKPDFVPSGDSFDFKYVVHADMPVDGNGNKLYSCHGNMSGKIKEYSVNEWLWMVQNCCVLHTNSYHGVCFGLMFNKKMKIANVDDFRVRNLFSLLNVEFENNEFDYQSFMKNMNI